MVKDITLFVLGVATGVGIASVVLKKKYEEILEEEIASVKEVYAASSDEEKEEEPEEASSESSEEEVKTTYKDITKTYKSDDSDNENTDIYVIKPEEYGMLDGYTLAGLNWYSNYVLTNEDGEVMDEDDIAVSVGNTSFVEHFGEFAEDEVCIRNETTKTDYQIIYLDEEYEE